ncbi:MAG: hypothetical protein AAGK97_03260, partial [Bacteroidota bacterium]
MLKLLKNRIAGIFDQELRYHAYFWIILWVAMVAFDDKDHGISFAIYVQAVHVFFIAAIVYFNLIYLFPNYLNQKNFLIYTLLLLVSALIITPIKTIVLYFVAFNFHDVQSYILQHQQVIFIS